MREDVSRLFSAVGINPTLRESLFSNNTRNSVLQKARTVGLAGMGKIKLSDAEVLAILRLPAENFEEFARKCNNYDELMRPTPRNET